MRRLLNDSSIRKISSDFDSDMFWEKGTGLSIYKYLGINKVIRIDLFKPMDIDKNVKVDISIERFNQKVNAS